MTSFLSLLSGHKSLTKRSSRTPKRALQFDTLETRLVPAAIAVVNGDLKIDGTAGADVVSVRLESGLVKVKENGIDTFSVAAGTVTGSIRFAGLAGSDRIDNLTSLRLFANGGAGNDTLGGSTGNDVLEGGLGEDYIFGHGGNDFLYANAANAIAGDSSYNYLSGGDGLDHLHGSDGNEYLDGGRGEDYLFGNGGNDQMHAANAITGDTSYNYLNGGVGNDTLYGGAGPDYLDGSAGADLLFGFGGNNSMYGGAGNDRLNSISRGDIVDGGADTDTLFVLAGTRTVVNGEIVRITVPSDQPQNDGWSCGPNSGSRFLRAYGINVSYSTLRGKVSENSLLSRFHLGTTPNTLRDVLKSYKSDITLEKESNMQKVLDLLGSGRPVIALVAVAKKSLSIGGSYGLMHYVVLNGFDKILQRISYVDTNGAQKSWTYKEFDTNWKWFEHFTGFLGEPMQLGLEALGLRKRTILF